MGIEDDLEFEKFLEDRKRKTDITQTFRDFIDQPPVRYEYKNPDLEKLLIASRMFHLRESIHRIQQKKALRLHILSAADREIDTQINYAASSLNEFTGWGLGYNPGVDKKRTFLEKQLSEFRKEKRQERRIAWRDMDSLDKDMRKLLEEYERLKARYRFLRDE